MDFINVILELLFPKACGVCGKIGNEYICEECYKEIKKYEYQNIKQDIFHLLKYEDIVRNKMLQYKFNDKSYLYNMFCEILVKNKNACDFLKNYDIIIPIPIHKKRKRERGYNQSELIAKKISYDLQIMLYTDVLKKYKNNEVQSTLNKADRIKNVQDVYKIENIERIKDKKVLLFDDIYTTGTTTKVCKTKLELAGAKKVGIMTIAKD